MKNKNVARPLDNEKDFLSPASAKKKWREPKLTFVEPKLTKHGNLHELTAQLTGFFGAFSP
jgi:hypothetical protein